MMLKKILAGTVLAAMAAVSVPSMPALANGAASTRNLLLLGGAAATYLIIQHNKKVHAQEAATANREAAAQESSHNAWAAYSSAEHAYQKEAALVSDLKREVAFQHNIVLQQQHLLAAAGLHPTYVAKSSPSSHAAPGKTTTASSQIVSNTQGLGWGTI